MTFEAVLLVETELPIPMTCEDGTGIAKGECLKLGDLATVSKAAVEEDYCGGIAGSEKIASDGMVKIDVYRGGIFKVHASGVITLGMAVTMADTSGTQPNHFKQADVSCSGSRTWGIALEDATDSDEFKMELRPGVQGNIH